MLYLLKDGEHYKIGYSTNLGNIMNTMDDTYLKNFYDNWYFYQEYYEKEKDKEPFKIKYKNGLL
jgi:hypothetical protein